MQRVQWSKGKRTGLWYPSSRVQTRPKPSGFYGEKILSTPSFGPMSYFAACKDPKMTWKSSFRLNLPDNILAHSSTLRY